jgi:hypothetical protein
MTSLNRIRIPGLSRRLLRAVREPPLYALTPGWRIGSGRAPISSGTRASTKAGYGAVREIADSELRQTSMRGVTDERSFEEDAAA